MKVSKLVNVKFSNKRDSKRTKRSILHQYNTNIIGRNSTGVKKVQGMSKIRKKIPSLSVSPRHAQADQNSLSFHPSHATLPTIDQSKRSQKRYRAQNESSRNPNKGLDAINSEFGFENDAFRVGLSLHHSKLSLNSNLVNSSVRGHRKGGTEHRVSFELTPMAKFTMKTQSELNKIMNEWRVSHQAYKNELKSYEESRDKMSQYSQQINYVADSLKHLAVIDPKVIQTIYYYNKRDQQSREREANRIAREYKTGKVDPTGSSNFHLNQL